MGFVACIFSFMRILGPLASAYRVLWSSCFDPTNPNPYHFDQTSSQKPYFDNSLNNLDLDANPGKFSFKTEPVSISVDLYFLHLLCWNSFPFLPSATIFFSLPSAGRDLNLSCWIFGTPKPLSSSTHSSSSSHCTLFFPTALTVSRSLPNFSCVWNQLLDTIFIACMLL